MHNINEPKNITYYSKIHEVAFYVLGDKENEIESNINITNSLVLRGDRPTENGVMDLHMGTTDHNLLCHTCGNRRNVCPGHFGSVELKYPVKSPMFRDELLKWLKIVCHKCGHIVTPIKYNVKLSRRINALLKTIKQVKKCHVCEAPYVPVAKDKKRPSIFLRVYGDEKNIRREDFYNHEIEAVLQKISPDDVIDLGKPLRSHPSKFILRIIKAPPNTMRPDIKRIGGTRTNISDTTSLLKQIIEINENLPDEIPTMDKMSSELKDMYFNLDTSYFAMIKGGGNGEIKLVTNTNKQPVSIADRIPKKPGRIRKNLMGKRVEYMIRSVITGDSRLKIHEVGVPMIHARNLEIPETVSEKNITRLSTYFMNKRNRYPGCKRIIKVADKNMYRIELISPNYKLQIGDIVLRDMITGDCLNFNRQPSLLFSNIAGMRVVVMDIGETLRINPAVCNYFNADFDGDQMNAIIPQNIQSRNECSNISKVARWFISPQTQAPLIGAFQDGLIGISEFTKDGLYFDKWHAMNVISDTDSKDTNYDFNKKLYSSREIISKLLPNINYSGRNAGIYKEAYAGLMEYNPNDIKVNIIRGELKSGILDKETCGQGTMGSIFHVIANEYGNDKSLDVIYNIQQLTHKFLIYHGFTTGIKDINISNEAMLEIKRRIAGMITESRRITQRLNNGKLIPPIGVTLFDFYEQEQFSALSAGDDFVEPILNDVNLNNNGILRLILTGSKGKPTNFIAINGAVGIQHINGRRFRPQAGWGRTSPYYVRYDTEPMASGYISTSFREGITNDVYPFTASEARQGMITNALSTSITGYQNRISIKNLESILTDNLRKATKGFNVIQPLYAECGLNPAKTENVKFPTIMISDEEFNNYKCDIKLLDKKYQNAGVEKLLKKEFEIIKEDREKFRRIHMKLEDNNVREYIMSNSKQMPVNVQHIIEDTIRKYEPINESIKAEDKILNPTDAIELVEDLCKNLGYVFLNNLQKKLKRKLPKYIVTATGLMQTLIRSHLCVSNLIKKGISNYLLSDIIEKIVMVYKKALVESGSTVGILAAQCISEPMTQFMLDSKHRTGGQGGTKTNEIVRMQEILGAKDTEIMKNPSMLIMVKPEYQEDKIKVNEIANNIEMMQFGIFISNTKIFHESYGEPVHKDFKHEREIISSITKHNIGQVVPSDLAKWCIRFEINKEKLIIKSVKLETIIFAIQKYVPKAYVIHTPENADTVFVRCYIKTSKLRDAGNNFLDKYVYTTMEEIKNVIVRGVDGIVSTTPVEFKKSYIKDDGSIATKTIYGIFTIGTNLSEILCHPDIDPITTQSDSIEEIERIFGLTAARNKILNELVNTLKNLNKMHCSIFADEMTFNGRVTSIQKIGLQKREMANVTLRTSFQMELQVLQDASVNGLVDRIGGVSGPLMVGTNPNIGTTYNSVLVNREFIEDYNNKMTSALEDL